MFKNLISIIVPNYNNAKYLPMCIESLINQTYKKIEIIVIDDGSTDDSLKLLKEYQKKDNRIILVSQKNQGVSKTRNLGISIAKGEYIIFLDSDDWLDTETCERAMEVMLEHSADVVLWSYMREYSNVSKTTFLFNDKKLIFEGEAVSELYRKIIGLIDDELSEPQKIDSIVTVWGKLYKKNVVGTVEFVDTNIIGTAEDALFNIYVFSRVQKAVYIPNAYSHYRKENEQSMTRNYKKQLVAKWIILHEKIKQHLVETDADSRCYEALNNRICLGLIGLGLNLAEDQSLSFKDKCEELHKVLNMSYYKKALKRFQLRFFPIHWKVFFFLAKQRRIIALNGMLFIMNKIRRL